MIYRSPYNTKIGVDIDGVIFNQTPVVIHLAKKWFNINIDYNDLTQFETSKCTPLTRTQANQIYQSPEFILALEPLKDARNALNILSKNHVWIELVSSRSNALYNETIDSLTHHDIPYDMLFLGISNKLGHATANRLIYFVEDRWKHAQNVSLYATDVFLFNYPWNYDRRDRKNIIRVGNNGENAWNEVLEYLSLKEVIKWTK